MLNEWSDRRPPGPPRPFYLRGEFWLGVFTVAICGGFLFGMLAWLLG